MKNDNIASTIKIGLSSKEISVYKDPKDAPPISGVYIFEIDRHTVKCGLSADVKKRFIQLESIKRYREVPMSGRAAVLSVDVPRLRTAERLFFSVLDGCIDNTELFKMPFEEALKAMRRLYDNTPPRVFHLTLEEILKEGSEQSDLEQSTTRDATNALIVGVKLIRALVAQEKLDVDDSVCFGARKWAKVFTTGNTTLLGLRGKNFTPVRADVREVSNLIAQSVKRTKDKKRNSGYCLRDIEAEFRDVEQSELGLATDEDGQILEVLMG